MDKLRPPCRDFPGFGLLRALHSSSLPSGYFAFSRPLRNRIRTAMVRWDSATHSVRSLRRPVDGELVVEVATNERERREWCEVGDTVIDTYGTSTDSGHSN